MSNGTRSPLAQLRADKKAARLASEQRMAAAQAETEAIVARGECPRCEAPLRRNWALAGWWQCGQFGAVGFRLNHELPGCTWQGFTR
jgi:hypothetical protein